MEREPPALSDGALSKLSSGLRELGLDAGLQAPLRRYVELLLLWNGTYNLTAIREPEAIISKHLLDCLAMAPFVSASSLVDVGSGGGFPGIPLALACPSLRVALVETAGKKARFLREAVRTLQLGDRVAVHAMRAEQVPAGVGFEVLTARAFGTLAEILRVGGHLLAPGGRLLAMKGRLDEVMAEPIPEGFRLEACHPMQVPGLDAERHLAIVSRTG
ncbi:16S rRNA (guanine(527)-N(7))-methyltransferase RsmG [Pseudomarimonas salicorniae]|uniref:Ribosomal RNA small subunit methyltransferase G n=1 Tax=Pseudomarimonas salicorniae TaxID=2933270 RepID=A0ABT0GGW2_9GAMM|nr:16S rRNA (guanine(527)-N(7))-methyltransferase RsmG [Lysobacter sp. CAU 1642]MCK7593597.1 16S rRNA (guanine(527)-N(7))-methyltransferase RsmG [Lysobacter sp. CAU 1642]